MATDQTWWALTETPKMKIGTKAVLCAMAIVSSKKDGKCYFWQSPARLAKFLGCSRSTVYKHINLLCALNLIEPSFKGYILCVQIPESGIRNPESTVQKPESTVRKPDTSIEREDEEINEEIMGREGAPELVEKGTLMKRAEMLAIPSDFACEWYERWYANGVFWNDSDMTKALKPFGSELSVLENRLIVKWAKHREEWMDDKKRGGKSTWELEKQKVNLEELMKNHSGNPKNEGSLGADQETIKEFRKLRDKRDEITKQLAGV